MVSIYNLHSLNRAVDGLISSNYNSIVAARNMLDALERQDSFELMYIQSGGVANVKKFYENQNEFIIWMTKASDNITEHKEREIINSISTHYKEYMEVYSELQQIKVGSIEKDINDFYDNNIHPTFLLVKKACGDLLELNESTMFESKNAASYKSKKLMYIMIGISVLSIVTGLIVAVIFTRKTVKPLHTLISTVKSVKEGELEQEIKVETKDEIGELAIEFNNMTKRLLVYEKTNIKSLILEKNKSLAIVKSISDPIIVTDNNNKIILLNKAAEIVFHVSEAKVIDKHFLESINNEEIYNKIKNTINDIHEDAHENIIKFEGFHETRYYFFTVAPIYDNEGYITGSVTILKDITSIKQMETMRTDFITTVSHEIRTPLTSVIMGIDLLSEDIVGSLNEEQKEIITAMEEESKQLTSLIDDLLGLSKLQWGKVELNYEEVRLQNIITQSMKVFYDIAANRNIKFSVDIPDNLPCVRIDTNKIIRVFNNLITNALKFTESGGAVNISAKQEDSCIKVIVSDTGAGIPKEYQTAIFERFIQVGQNSKEYGGVGLGLPISKEYVKRHGGDIWVESHIGSGSSFIFTLPI
jgi:PAS domain S-box-containing protein